MFRYNYTYRHTEKHSERHIEITADGQTHIIRDDLIYTDQQTNWQKDSVFYFIHSQTYKVKKTCIHGMKKYKQIYRNIKTEDLTQREEKKVITAGLTNTEGYND